MKQRDMTCGDALRALMKSADSLATCGPPEQQRWVEQVLDDCEVAGFVLQRRQSASEDESEETLDLLADWDNLVTENAELNRQLVDMYERIIPEEIAKRLAPARDIVDAQAEDEALWFTNASASEAYLQAELRRLHAAIEGEGRSRP